MTVCDQCAWLSMTIAKLVRDALDTVDICAAKTAFTCIIISTHMLAIIHSFIHFTRILGRLSRPN